jgi:hypothetical protein
LLDLGLLCPEILCPEICYRPLYCPALWILAGLDLDKVIS